MRKKHPKDLLDPGFPNQKKPFYCTLWEWNVSSSEATLPSSLPRRFRRFRVDVTDRHRHRARALGAPDGKDRPSQELASSTFCHGRLPSDAQRAALEERPPRRAQVATHGGEIRHRTARVRGRHLRVDVAAALARAAGREAGRLPAGGGARRAPRPRGDAPPVLPPGARGRFRVGLERGAPPAPRGARALAAAAASRRVSRRVSARPAGA